MIWNYDADGNLVGYYGYTIFEMYSVYIYEQFRLQTLQSVHSFEIVLCAK